MAEIPKVYVDACPFIDMAKHKARLPMDPNPDTQANRERDVWVLDRLLRASRGGEISVLTSLLTITECLFLGNEPDKVPDAETQRFFTEMLLSGKSGVITASPTLAIMEGARDLRWKRGIILKPMDSLHVATALHNHCKEIITNDRDIHNDSVRLKLESLGIFVVHPRNTSILPAKYAQRELSDAPN